MEFQWMNQSEIRKEGSRIEIMATPQSDFFCNSGCVSEEGITPESLSNAPYYYTEVEGDFVLKVRVSHAFRDIYDSASVMVMVDLKNWAKACFEKTDFGTMRRSASSPSGVNQMTPTGAIWRGTPPGSKCAACRTPSRSIIPWTASILP